MFLAAVNNKGFSRISSIDRLDSYTLTVSGAGAAPDVFYKSISDLIELACSVPRYDLVEIHVELDGELLKLVGSCVEDTNKLARHFSDNSDFEKSSVKLSVRKGREGGRVSVYDLSALGAHWTESSIADSLASIAEFFDQGLSFVCMEDGAPSFGSKTIRFIGRDDVVDMQDGTGARESKFDVFLENCSVFGQQVRFLPSDFKLIDSSELSLLDRFFAEAAATLSAIFLSNSSSLIGSVLNYRILGYKAIGGEVRTADLVVSSQWLYKIYEWSYESGASSDKIGLARNVISLHASGLESLDEPDPLWRALQSNYQIYLKGNVASYLEVKGKVADFLVEASGQARAAAQGVVSSLKSGVALMVSFVLGVVVVNGIKDNGAQAFFSPTYLWTAVLIVLICSLWLFLEVLAARRSLEESEASILEIVSGGYSKILDQSEIDESVRPVFIRNKALLRSEVWRVCISWLLSAAAVVLFFAVGTWAHAKSSVREAAALGSAAHTYGKSASDQDVFLSRNNGPGRNARIEVNRCSRLPNAARSVAE